MKTKILSEKNLVVILFVMVLITFSLAQEYTKKMEKIYLGATATAASSLLVNQPEVKKTATRANGELTVMPGE